jgi:hypothetical protein
MCRRLLSFVLAIFLVFFQNVRPAKGDVGDVLGEVASYLPGVVMLRAGARAVVGGATEGFREQAELFIENKIDPMISRADAILHARIEQGAQEAMRLLKQAEASLNSIIDHANLAVQNNINLFFVNLNSTIDTTFARIDNLLDEHLCKISPYGRGIYGEIVVDIADLKNKPSNSLRPDRIEVEDYKTNKYAIGLVIDSLIEKKERVKGDRKLGKAKITKAVYVGWFYYVYKIKEINDNIINIDPEKDKDAVYKLENLYRKLAGLHKESVCFDLTNDKSASLIGELQSESKALFYMNLRNGNSSIISN